MLVCSFDHKGVVHYEFIGQGQTVNEQCYLEVLTRLRESVRRKRAGLWPDKWILHHDNAPAHDALRVREFLAKNSITKMDGPPYSPDLAPCDFWLFPKLKNALKGQTFADLLTSNATSKLYCEVFRKMIFKTVSGSGTIVSRSAQLQQETISKATAAASAQVKMICFNRAIPGIKLSHLLCTYLCMYVFMYVRIYVCTYLCMYVCIYVCIYVFIYVCM